MIYCNDDSDKVDGKFYCPNCGKILDNQFLFNEYEDDWICTECGAHLHHEYSDDPYSIVCDGEDNFNFNDDSDASALGAIILLGLAGVVAANIKRHTKERTEHKKERKSPLNTSSSSTYSNPTLYSTPNAKRVKQKSFLQKHWKGTFLVVLSLAVIAATTFLIWEYQKLIPIGYDSNALMGVNYKAVISNLEDAGFTNVQVESTADLDISDIAEECQVYEIEVLGKTEFDSSTKYPYDIRIVIKYHTLKLITPPLSNKEAKGMNYFDVISEFESAGFANIHTNIKYDVVLGWFAKDGEIENVTIDGEKKFDATSKIRPDAEIMITYHSYKSNKP